MLGPLPDKGLRARNPIFGVLKIRQEICFVTQTFMPGMAVPVHVVCMPHYPCEILPEYKTVGSAGVDLYAAVSSDLVVQPLERVMVPTGLQVAIPPGFEGQVRPRSGLAIKHGLTVVNAPGTIDADYRGEIRILLINLGTSAFIIQKAMRVAQFVLTPVARIQWEPTSSLPETGRGAGGFGHTGMH